MTRNFFNVKQWQQIEIIYGLHCMETTQHLRERREKYLLTLV